MKILNSKFDAKCKACGTFINAGDSVRWSKADGVSWTTCMACPHEPKAKGTTPANGTPTMSAADAAAQADRNTAARKIGELEALLATARDHFREQRSEIAALKDALAVSEQVRLAQAAHILALTAAPSALVEAANHALALDADDDCPL